MIIDNNESLRRELDDMLSMDPDDIFLRFNCRNGNYRWSDHYGLNFNDLGEEDKIDIKAIIVRYMTRRAKALAEDLYMLKFLETSPFDCDSNISKEMTWSSIMSRTSEDNKIIVKELKDENKDTNRCSIDI